MTVFRFLFILSALVLASCGVASEGSSDLTGSIAETYTLDYQFVTVHLQDDFVIVDFNRVTDRGTGSVLKIAVRARDLPPGESSVISGEAFHERVFLRRVWHEPPSRFPDVAEGSLRLDEFTFKSFASIEGELRVRFVDGHTLNAAFAGLADEILELEASQANASQE